jgi:hypothetical protein
VVWNRLLQADSEGPSLIRYIVLHLVSISPYARGTLSLLLSFLSQEKERRRVRNGMDKVSGEELPRRDEVPAFSFCDIIFVSPLFI